MKLIKELFDEGKIFVESEAMRHHIRLNRFVENHNDLFNKYFGCELPSDGVPPITGLRKKP